MSLISWRKFEKCSKCAMSTVTGVVAYVIKNVIYVIVIIISYEHCEKLRKNSGVHPVENNVKMYRFFCHIFFTKNTVNNQLLSSKS